ncbi:MAG: transposase [Planctomycetes bacterium]|nr:transposase [Planctomycetota bacterium]
MYYCGIDLGSMHSQICIIDADDHVLYNKKLRNNIESFVHLLQEYGAHIRVLVESTFNWDWIVDGLQAAGIEVTLAHSFGIKAITTAKVKTDKRDAKTLAQLLRVKMRLRTAH